MAVDYLTEGKKAYVAGLYDCAGTIRQVSVNTEEGVQFSTGFVISDKAYEDFEPEQLQAVLESYMDHVPRSMICKGKRYRVTHALLLGDNGVVLKNVRVVG